MALMNFRCIPNVRLAALLLAVLLTGKASAQQTAGFVAQLDSVLVLDGAQREKITAICAETSAEITAIDKTIQALSRSDAEAAEKEKRITEAAERKKAIRDSRDAGIRALLTPEQQRLYDEKVKPARPAVLHFGMNHDRANCVVCVK